MCEGGGGAVQAREAEGPANGDPSPLQQLLAVGGGSFFLLLCCI